MGVDLGLSKNEVVNKNVWLVFIEISFDLWQRVNLLNYKVNYLRIVL